MSAPYYADESVTIHHGDCLDVLRSLPDASVDSVVTDPPYGLEFMGKDWDRPWAVTASAGVGFEGREDDLTLPSHRDSRNANCRACGGRQRGARRCVCSSPKWDHDPAADMREFGAWCELWAVECLRVLKPGGHLLAFGGSRTWHRLTCAVEDAGFEIRDSIAWLYGSGFPKSLDVSKAIDKAAGIWRGKAGEPVTGNDSMSGANYERTDKGDPITAAAAAAGWGTALKPAFEPIVVARKPLVGTVAANFTAHGTGALNIDGCRVDMGDEYDATRVQRQSAATAGMNGLGESGFSANHEQATYNASGRWPANVILDESQADALDEQSGELTSGLVLPHHADNGKAAGTLGAFAGAPGRESYGDTGGASRFFYVAKADSSERPRVDGIAHPTVKPLALMRWLVRLVTPPGGTVLEPFAGSGTTVEACVIEHFRCIAIEREADYLPLIESRIARRVDPVKALKLAGDDLGLFGLGEIA